MSLLESYGISFTDNSELLCIRITEKCKILQFCLHLSIFHINPTFACTCARARSH